MFIVELVNRVTSTSLGYLSEITWRNKTGIGLQPFSFEAKRFKSEREASHQATDFVADNAKTLIIIKEVKL